MWVGLKIICLVPKMVASISFVFPSVPLKSFSCHFLALNSTVVVVSVLLLYLCSCYLLRVFYVFYVLFVCQLSYIVFCF